jgi:hypothetical protein
MGSSSSTPRRARDSLGVWGHGFRTTRGVALASMFFKDGDAFEPIGAGRVYLDEFQKAFGAEAEEFVEEFVGFHLAHRRNV